MRYLLILFLLATSALQAQTRYTGDSLYFLYPTDTVTMYSRNGSGALLLDHYLAPHQTLYGASRFYGVNLESCYELRPDLREGYQAGDAVTVPLTGAVIQRALPVDSLAWFVPVRYRLAKGETFYGLATRRLGWLNDAPLRALNPKVNPERLEPGQVVNIGYMSVAGLPPSALAGLSPYAVRNRPLRTIFEGGAADRQLIQENGKAAWRNKGGDKFMVLHRSAPLESIIEVTDPRSRKTFYARVKGRIPSQIFGPDIMLVVSPVLVKAFGVRDKEFYVRTRRF